MESSSSLLSEDVLSLTFDKGRMEVREEDDDDDGDRDGVVEEEIDGGGMIIDLNGRVSSPSVIMSFSEARSDPLGAIGPWYLKVSRDVT